MTRLFDATVLIVGICAAYQSRLMSSGVWEGAILPLSAALCFLYLLVRLALAAGVAGSGGMDDGGGDWGSFDGDLGDGGDGGD
jgi:hypothetical protein